MQQGHQIPNAFSSFWVNDARFAQIASLYKMNSYNIQVLVTFMKNKIKIC